MKKVLLLTIATAAISAACCKFESATVSGGGLTSLSLTVPEAMGVSTKAVSYVNSAKGAVTNVGSDGLLWEVDITHKKSGNTAYSQTQFGGTAHNASVPLAKGEVYVLEASARYDNQVEFNTEYEDYYTVTKEFTAGDGTLDATLMRPVGKLRLVATDYDEFMKQTKRVLKSISISYSGASNASYTDSEFNSYVVEDLGTTMFVDYLSGNDDGTAKLYKFDVTFTMVDGTVKTLNVTQDIPVKENCLTTVVGNIFTGITDLSIIIDEKFSEKEDVNYVAPAPINLSANGTANSYIVPEAGLYMLKAVKGNSTELLENVTAYEVLWESFGNATAPSVGDLITEVTPVCDYVQFKASEKKGNALIAAKDASGKILWSWHIWMTDQPSEQEYYNNAGIMMDRNLGATSITPGDVEAIGLMYQWGRKDPFMGACIVDQNTSTASTGKWSYLRSDEQKGTISYALEHPMTFIVANTANSDWYYTGNTSTDDSRWQPVKTIYDPCPPGWMVPEGGNNGIWGTALGVRWQAPKYDNVNYGMDFSKKFGDDSSIWYPAGGMLDPNNGRLYSSINHGHYWTITPDTHFAFDMYFNYNNSLFPAYDSRRAGGYSVRCCKE